MSREVVFREVECREVVPCVLREVVDWILKRAVIGVGVCHIDAAARQGRRCAVEVCLEQFAEMAVVNLA
eukprot:1140062-Pelagomonas_calceolata.AAC.1